MITAARIRMNSLIARIENAANAVLDGRPVQPSRLQVRRIALGVRFLLKENRRLTLSNVQLRRLLLEQQEQLKQLQSLRRREASAQPNLRGSGQPPKLNPWDNSNTPPGYTGL